MILVSPGQWNFGMNHSISLCENITREQLRSRADQDWHSEIRVMPGYGPGSVSLIAGVQNHSVPQRENKIIER